MVVEVQTKRLIHYALGVAMVLGMIAILLTSFILLYVHSRVQEEITIIGAEDMEVDLKRILKKVRVKTKEGIVEMTPEEANKSATLLIERALNGDEEAIEEINGTYGIIKIRKENAKYEMEYVSMIGPPSFPYLRSIAFYPPLPITLNLNGIRYRLAILFSYEAPYPACTVIIVFKESIKGAVSYNAIGFGPFMMNYTVHPDLNITVRWFNCVLKSQTSYLLLVPDEYQELHVIGVVIDTGFLSGVVRKFEIFYLGEKHAQE